MLMLRWRCCAVLVHLKPSVVATECSLGVPIRMRRQRTVPLTITSSTSHTIRKVHNRESTEGGSSSSSSEFRITQTVPSPSLRLRDLGRRLGLRPAAELALLSVFLVLFTAIGAIISLAIISIPIMSAFNRLGTSMDKLSKVISKEVPGTLLSLKLSVHEINDLTQQLSNLGQKISGSTYRQKDRKQ